MKHTAQLYIQEWVNKTGRAPSDVYVPEALREPSFRAGQFVTVSGAPGYADFPGTLLRTVQSVDGRGTLAVVQSHYQDLHVVPLSCVTPGPVPLTTRDHVEILSGLNAGEEGRIERVRADGVYHVRLTTNYREVVSAFREDVEWRRI